MSGLVFLFKKINQNQIAISIQSKQMFPPCATPTMTIRLPKLLFESLKIDALIQLGPLNKIIPLIHLYKSVSHWQCHCSKSTSYGTDELFLISQNSHLGFIS